MNKTTTIGKDMKYISKDLKDRIIKKYLDTSMTRKQVAEHYDVSIGLVKKSITNEEGLEQKIRKRTKKLQLYHIDYLKLVREADIVVMDNCAFHKGYIKDVLKDLLDSIGVTLIFLPPYSREFSPVEKVFSKLKKLLKRNEEECIPYAIATSLQEVCMEDMLGYYKNCFCF